MNDYYYDLHIHSCLSPCADDDMTPNNIAGMAALKGLNIVALTDHNSCKNCPAFFAAAKKYGIIPIAGMELTTAEDIHLVCLFEELQNAMSFDQEISDHLMAVENRSNIFGNQLILDSDDEIIGEEKTLLISATDLWINEAINIVKKHDGHVHPAHIDRESNGIIAILGDIPNEYNFNFVEFNEKSNIENYCNQYQNIKDKKIIVSSDAHHLWDINEKENFISLQDEPYSSSLVRKNLFTFLGI
jgi:predicted metal-dependent phosphoesterase TrpH